MRRSSTVATASCVSADAVVATSRRTRPSTTIGSASVGRRARRRPARRCTASRTPRRRRPRPRSVTASTSASSTMTIAGWTDPAGKCSASTSSPATASTSVRKMSTWLVPDAFSVGRNAAPTPRARAVTIHTGRALRPTNRASRGHRPGPSAGSGSTVVSTCACSAAVGDDRRGPRRARPEQDARALAEDEQQRGQERERAEQRGRDADRGDRAEAAVGAEVGQQEAQHAGDDGAGAGGDRLDARPQRAPHRGRRVLDAGELLPVARDEQQRVVHRRADHEDRQDALRLPVEHERAVRGEVVDHETGEAEREHRGEDHDERQERRAVDQHEDQQHGAERDEQQDAVDAAERGDEVGDEPGGTGDPRLEPELAGRRRGGAELGLQATSRRATTNESVTPSSSASSSSAFAPSSEKRDEHRLAVLATARPPPHRRGSRTRCRRCRAAAPGPAPPAPSPARRPAARG